jgi:FkbM family methyltransferase
MLQRIFGYSNYLFLFSCIKIFTLRFDGKKKDYLLFVKMISATDNGIIIGANTGITTVPIAKTTSGKIFAIEPVPENSSVLAKTIDFFGVRHSITILECALGNENRPVHMKVPIRGSALKHGFAHVSEVTYFKSRESKTSVTMMRRLDDVSEIQNTKIHFVKLVAENYEFNILSGGKQTITGNKPIIYCELWENAEREKVLTLVKSYGYEIYVFRNRELCSYDPVKDSKKNFIFIPAKKQ